ncbi:MAG: SWIM/SEC-C metal-binding protein [Candidatus Azotimanducaceae bacterium]|jgi:SWIM/SEC-C metal-binding protein
MAKIFQKGPVMKKGDRAKTNFENKGAMRLGSKKSPAQIRVQTAEREKELAAVCAENGWACVIEVDSEQNEDIHSLEALRTKQVTSVSEKTPNRNDPCSCDSGKKYKKCCGA